MTLRYPLNTNCDRFWIIALPLMSIVLPIFLGSDLQRIWHYMQKRAAARTVKEVGALRHLCGCYQLLIAGAEIQAGLVVQEDQLPVTFIHRCRPHLFVPNLLSFSKRLLHACIHTYHIQYLRS